MKKLIVVAVSLFVVASALAAEPGKRVIITFKSGTDLAAREKALQSMGVVELGAIESSDKNRSFVAVVAEIPGNSPVLQTEKGLMSLGDASASSDVVKIEEDYRIKWIEEAPSFQAAPFDAAASFKDLGLHKFNSSQSVQVAALRPKIPWGVERVGAPAAWDYTEGAGVRVAVIDTGIDATHPDLQGKVDGGYNAITDSEAPGSYADDNGHGTHVAGTIGGRRDGNAVGVAPKARLYAVKVLDAKGSGNLSDVIKGIVWCANNDMQVANMSLGSSQGSDTMQRALRYAKARGVVVVAAAGNSGGAVGFPAAYPETIAVAASDPDNHIAEFSSRGPEVKFIAPGKWIVSTRMGGDYVSMSGTSMAAPHVTGLAALAVSQGWRGLDGPDGVMEQLRKAAKPLPGLTALEQGYGMINAGRLTHTSLLSVSIH